MDCLAQRKKFKKKHPAWSDPSDPKFQHDETGEEPAEDVEAEKRGDDVREQEPLADSSGVSSDDDDDDYDMYANDVRKKALSLETKELRYKHLVSINNERSFHGSVQQVQFNPKSKLALVTLTTGQADLYEANGERNRYIQNVKLPRTKRPFCSFTPDGNSIVIASKSYKGSFYTYDMVTASIKSYRLRVGRDLRDISDFSIHQDYMACRLEGSQEIHVLSSKTYENTFSVKINEPVKAIQFSPNNSNDMFIAGENARVYIWDLRKTNLCKHRFQDEGSVHTTSMSLSESSQLLSVGSDSGIVNSYELDQCLTNKFPVPIRTFANLKTSVDILRYNSSGELLLMGSTSSPGAFRMVHSHSGTVYKNFPKPGKKYEHLLSADFSPLSGYLALGCSTGRAHLCRIPYYKYY